MIAEILATEIYYLHIEVGYFTKGYYATLCPGYNTLKQATNSEWVSIAIALSILVLHLL